jgi:hypothetical protein
MNRDNMRSFRRPVPFKRAVHALEVAYGAGNVKRVRRAILCFVGGRVVARRDVLKGMAYL